MSLILHEQRERLFVLTLPLLVALVYVVAFPGHFFMDDIQIVLQNNFTYNWDLKRIFTSDYWGAGENTGLYRPLTILSFAANAALFGPEAWGYLLVNVLLHTLVCSLFFVYLRQLGVSLTASWLAAAIFAVHPIHAEPVIQLVGRSELLVGCFGLTALILARSAGRYAIFGVVACFVAAIFSKEHGVVLIGIIPLVDLFVDRSSLREILKRRAVLLALLVGITVLWLLYRSLVVHAGIEGPSSFDPYYIPLKSVDNATRVLSALKLQVDYLGKQFFPYHLQAMYPASVVRPFVEWISWWSLTIFCVLAGLGAAVYQGWRRREWWGLAIVLYVVSFSPTANVLFPTDFIMADRMAYFPSLWFCFAFAAALTSGLKRLPQAWRRNLLCVVIVLAYSLTGVGRADDFRTIEGLWLNDLRINPRNEISTLILADYYRAQGRGQEAEVMLRDLTQVAPDFEKGLSTYAGVLVENKRYDEAIKVARQAIQLEEALNGVSSARLPLASAYMEMGRPEEAAKILDTVSTSDSLRPVYWELRGRSSEAKGDYLTALSYYLKELDCSGERSLDGFRRIGRIYLQLGNSTEAETALLRDVKINPTSADGWNLLGVALAGRNLLFEAQEAFQQAVKLKPESAEYRANLERAQGR